MKILPVFLYLTTTLLFLISTLNTAYATSYDDLAPHPPSGSPWSEQWFYNLNDPDQGYFKVTLQTYITPGSNQQNLGGYVHFAYSSKTGITKTYEYFSDEVIVEQVPGAKGNSFHFQIPGIVDADENTLSLTLQDINFHMSWVGVHTPYWPTLNPAQSPFRILSELPGLGAHWFVWTIKTPTQYTYSDDGQNLSGFGWSNVDKGWYDKEVYGSYMYALAVTGQYQLLLSGGTAKNSAIEVWAGQFRSEDEVISFLPTFKGLGVKRTLDTCRGLLDIELNKVSRKVVIHAQSAPSDFYDARMPSQIVFNAEKPVMKTMQASFSIKVYHWGQLQKEVTLPQGLMEFAGDAYCDQ